MSKVRDIIENKRTTTPTKVGDAVNVDEAVSKGQVTGATPLTNLNADLLGGVASTSYVQKSSTSALDTADPLRISGTTLSLYRGDGTSDSVTLPSSVPTSAQVGSATAGLAVQSVGTYCIAMYVSAGTTNTGLQVTAGAIIAGSSLREAGFELKSASSVIGDYVNALPGTWRCLANVHDANTFYPTTLFLRIA